MLVGFMLRLMGVFNLSLSSTPLRLCPFIPGTARNYYEQCWRLQR